MLIHRHYHGYMLNYYELNECTNNNCEKMEVVCLLGLVWMIGLNDWSEWLVWMIGLNDWSEWLVWMIGLNDWSEWLIWMIGLNDWSEWLVWMIGLNDWSEWLVWMICLGHMLIYIYVMRSVCELLWTEMARTHPTWHGNIINPVFTGSWTHPTWHGSIINPVFTGSWTHSHATW